MLAAWPATRTGCLIPLGFHLAKALPQVRFTKSLQRGSTVTDTPAIATITYDTTDTPTTEQQRFKNPLGLEVQTYRADLEVTQ